MLTNLGKVLSARRRDMGLSQSELAERLKILGINVTNQAVSKWENGSTEPGAEQFLALCAALGIEDVRGVFYSGGSGGCLDGLNYEGRKKALEYIDLLRTSGRYAPRPAKDGTPRLLPLYSLAVSAGTGQFLDGEDYEMTEVGPGVAPDADFGVRVAGDSMEPQFHDGEIVWVKQQSALQNGETGILLYDGSAYLKQLLTDGQHAALHSLNPRYADIKVSPALQLRILGRVL